jgi:arabinan endo-1,5-alpha-L-arabinosidase
MTLRFSRLAVVFLSIALLLATFVVTRALPQAAAATLAPTISGDLAAHDPDIIRQGSIYYVFATGGGIQIRTSPDLIHWTLSGQVFSKIPAWITKAEGNIGGLWAPDISYANGVYHLYYAGSQLGKRNSVIGLATNTTLDPKSSSYKWVDQGLVLQTSSANNYNAIDPSFLYDAKHVPWLAFGSWWTGLKIRQLDPTTFKLSKTNTTLYSLAYRAKGIEASSLAYHNGYYYLFASIGTCCSGLSSTYQTVYGRATSISGPYYSETGVPMLQGGYTLVLQSNGNVRAPGGESAYNDGSRELLIYHYYDASANGATKIQIRQILWTSNNWLTLSNPVS